MLKDSLDNVRVVILAAGKGTRMKSDMLKPLHCLRGKPLIEYVVRAVEESGITKKPIVVVPGDSRAIQEYLGDRALYAIQTEQLGTGHAVSSVKPFVETAVEHVVILSADVPCIRASSISRLVEEHCRERNTITFMTTVVPHFDGWYAMFWSFGRIIRGRDGLVVRNVEMKDATAEEQTLREVNTSGYCFDASWLWGHLGVLLNQNAQQEYYITDLFELAVREGRSISTIPIGVEEAIGITTPDDIQLADALFDETHI